MISDEQFKSLTKIFEEIEKAQEQSLKMLNFETMIIKKLKNSIEQNLKKITFQCQFCVESFQDKQLLIDHQMETHNIRTLYYGPDIFTCRVCFKEFKGTINLLLHLKQVQHPIKYVLDTRDKT